MLSALTGARAIAVHFDTPATIDLARFKALVREYMRYDQERPEPFLPQEDVIESVLVRVNAAHSVAEVFKILAVPAPEDSLDVICGEARACRS